MFEVSSRASTPAIMMTSANMDAIKQYSIAVVPPSSRRKFSILGVMLGR